MVNRESGDELKIFVKNDIIFNMANYKWYINLIDHTF